LQPELVNVAANTRITEYERHLRDLVHLLASTPTKNEPGRNSRSATPPTAFSSTASSSARPNGPNYWPMPWSSCAATAPGRPRVPWSK
jgi:hypothetical protein